MSQLAIKIDPVLRLCDDGVIGSQDVSFCIGLIAGTLFVASLLSSVFLYVLGNYYMYYKCSKIWLCWCCPIIHPMFLDDVLLASDSIFLDILESAANFNRNIFFVQNRLSSETTYSMSKRLNESEGVYRGSLEKRVWFKVLHDEEKFSKKEKVCRTPPLQYVLIKGNINLYIILTFLGVSSMSQDENGWRADKILLTTFNSPIGFNTGSYLFGKWLFRDQEWIRLFKEATDQKFDQCLSLLLENKPNVNVFNHEDGNTALHYSCSVQNSDVVKQLLSNQCDVNARNFEGESALHLIAAKGHSNIMELLLENHANVNVKDVRKSTPLHYAAEVGSLHCCKLLINRQSDVNVRNWIAKTPLHLSASRNNVECMKYLIENKADVNVVDHYKESPLHHASACGFFDACKLIIESGGDINARNMDGDTPLHQAGSGKQFYSSPEADFVKCFLLLVSSGADLEIRNDNLLTPLECELVEDLITDSPELFQEP